MADIKLPEKMDDDFVRLIPSQRAYVNRMMKKGIITSYSLSFNRRKLWVVLNADDRVNAHEIIGAFPIYPYISYELYSLLFHESNTINAPQLWLN
jgi:muconolactone delta-isomerase